MDEGDGAPPIEEVGGLRLQKVLARAGYGSRRRCEELIEQGRVRVDGAVARLGRRVDPDVARITVDDAPAPTAPGHVYYLLNKPAGVVTTADDPQGRPTVLELVPSEPRVFAVGRLDRATEGLLILTNDGDLSHVLSHPSHGVVKEYLAQVRGDPSPQAIRMLREGITLDDGVTAPARVSRVEAGLLRIAIHEGRNRQVRRMCSAVGHEVERLVRTRIGPVADTTLAPGTYRDLAPAEVRRLGEAAVGPLAAPA